MAQPAPTAEQQKIIEAAQTGGNLVIEAGAGTGKTTTLKLVAQALAPKRGLYIAYNKAIQVEAAASFPENVTCKTAHSLAYRSHGAPNARRLNGQRINARVAAQILSIQPFVTDLVVRGDSDKLEVTPRQIAVSVREAIGRFCNSADREPSYFHIPTPDVLTDEGKRAYRNHVLPYVKAAWEDINRKGGRLTQPYFSHDCYLKMWTLTDPQMGYDFVLFDEAQDANPCIAYVVQIQKAQQIMVGDRAQAIYGWRGAVDAMQNFKADHHLYLTQSFRFGNAVAEQANRWLNLVGTPLRLTGFEKIASTVDSLEQPNAILCRTNAGCIEAAMNMQANGVKVAIQGGTKQIESFAKAANDLMQGLGCDHPELGIYKTWNEVQKAVQDGEASDLGAMVRIIDNYGVVAVLEVCRNSSKVEDADVVVSTAHKAKGLEWDGVRIHGDFKAPKEGGKLSVSEAMLIYVAVTRAKLTLDNVALSWLDQMEREINETMDEGEAA